MTLKERLTEISNDLVGDHYGADAEFARRLGVSRSLVSQWRHGTLTSLSAVMALRIHDKTGYCVKWIATGLGPKRNSDKAPAQTSIAEPLEPDEKKLLEIIRIFQESDTVGKDVILKAARSRGRRHVAGGAKHRKRPLSPDGG